MEILKNRGDRWVAMILLLASGLGCSTSAAKRASIEIVKPPVRSPQTDHDPLKTRLRAFGKAIGTAADNEPALLETWLGCAAPHTASPLPVVPIDNFGTVLTVTKDVRAEDGWNLRKESEDRWRITTVMGDQSRTARTESFAIRPGSSPPGSVLINHYESLPIEARILNGIGWALTELPHPELIGPQCLRDQLGLIVPAQTVARIEASLGPVAVFGSTTGMLRFDFQLHGKTYNLFVEQFQVEGKTARSTLLLSGEELDDPANSLTRKYGLAEPGRWSELSGGLASL